MEQKNIINITVMSDNKDNKNDHFEPEAPSPASIPLSQSYVVPAETIQRYNPTCNFQGSELNIYINDNLQNDNFSLKLKETSDFWIINKKYFQDNFNILYNFLTSLFANGQPENFIIHQKDSLKLIFTQEGLFSFNITLEIPKEGSVDLVKQEMTGLQRKIEKLEYFITTMIFQTSLGKTKLSEDWKDEHLEDNQSESIPLDLDDLWDKIDECYSQFKN